MKPIHALAIAVALAVAAVLGVSAATRTSHLGTSARQASTTAIAARARKLDAFEASLQKALENKPPALPKVPAGRDVASAGTSVSAPRVIYRRPAPIIIHKHGHHGDDGFESERSGAAGGEGGGND